LFGPPDRVTGFVRNSRLLGHLDVPDSFLVHRELFFFLLLEVLIFARAIRHLPGIGLFWTLTDSVKKMSSPAVHYDPRPDQPSRHLPLLATARGSILSLQDPQSRFTLKGNRATFVKFGVDVQEAQLVAEGADALDKDEFARDPEELFGTLYALDGETGKPAAPQT
jgi:hypothetical protein